MAEKLLPVGKQKKMDRVDWQQELAVDLEVKDLEEQSLSRAERFAQKVGRRQQELVVEMQQKEVMIEGLLSIQAGENPRVIEEKLKSFLPPKDRTSADGEEEAGGEA